MKKIIFCVGAIILLCFLKLSTSSFICGKLLIKSNRRFGPQSSSSVHLPSKAIVQPLQYDPVNISTPARRNFLSDITQTIEFGASNAGNIINAGLNTIEMVFNVSHGHIKVPDFRETIIQAFSGDVSFKAQADLVIQQLRFEVTDQCSDSYLLRRFQDLTKISWKEADVYANYQQLVEDDDMDLKAFLLVAYEVEPLTNGNFVEYIKWMIQVNNLRLPFVIRFAQKVLGLMHMKFHYFRDNFIAFLKHLAVPSRDNRGWILNMVSENDSPFCMIRFPSPHEIFFKQGT